MTCLCRRAGGKIGLWICAAQYIIVTQRWHKFVAWNMKSNFGHFHLRQQIEVFSVTSVVSEFMWFLSHYIHLRYNPVLVGLTRRVQIKKTRTISVVGGGNLFVWSHYNDLHTEVAAVAPLNAMIKNVALSPHPCYHLLTNKLACTAHQLQTSYTHWLQWPQWL